MTVPRTCATCRAKPVAAPRYQHCFDCVPGGPRIPPPCRRCGSTRDYYSSGLCARCHRFAPDRVDSCVDCLAWGVDRHHGWLCEPCRSWRSRYLGQAECLFCRRRLAVSPDGACRLCWRQAAMLRCTHRDTSLSEANRHGQQLFLVGMFRQKRDHAARSGSPLPIAGQYPARHQQLVLFDQARDLTRTRLGADEPPLPALAALLDHTAVDHAERHGWSRTRLVTARAAIRSILALQDAPGFLITVSEVSALAPLGFNIQPVLEILTAAEMLDDDREPAITGWFARQVEDLGLPEPMLSELTTWFQILRDGSTTAPRSRPRSHVTIRIRVRTLLPTLRAWSAAGHNSLREITRDQVRAALPAAGSPRALLGSALRSLFRVLKARKMVFANPTARLRTGRPETRQPLPLDLDVLREAISSTNPARTAIAALFAFHAPRNQQVRELQLTDVRDGRLYLPERTVLLAEPVRARISAWLEHRIRRWPSTANPHLFVNTYTAVRSGPVSTVWVNDTLGVSPQAVREDRILHEAIASGGDVRRLCDLFGLSVRGAERYADVVHDALGGHLGSATQGPN